MDPAWRWFYRHIGAAIKKRRKECEWTQEKLARHLGISRALLANIEIGRQSIVLHRLYHIAGTLRVNIAEFLPPARTDDEGDDLPLPENLSSVQRAQITRAVRETIPNE